MSKKGKLIPITAGRPNELLQHVAVSARRVRQGIAITFVPPAAENFLRRVPSLLGLADYASNAKTTDRSVADLEEGEAVKY